MRVRVGRWGVGALSCGMLAGGLMGAAPAARAEESAGPVLLTTQVAAPVVSQKAFGIDVAGTPAAPLVPGQAVSVQWRDPSTGRRELAYAPVESDGVARFRLRLWRSARIRVTYADVRTTSRVIVRPARHPMRRPDGAPNPPARFRQNPDPAAFGVGANPVIRSVSPRQRRQMTGLSWRPGCVPFGELREVHVNYWGADGYRHRGLLIARASVARRVAAVFVDLYGLGYRLRSLHPVDRYGPSPRGPGASDYASMAAGNTSMFNCRYAVGRESAGVWSPHATGLSLDINPWENPYRGPGGVYPNAWWLVHRHGSAMLIRPGGPVVRILARHGWRWSGSRDLHHFDYRG